MTFALQFFVFSVQVPLVEPLERVVPFVLPVVVIVCLALVDQV